MTSLYILYCELIYTHICRRKKNLCKWTINRIFLNMINIKLKFCYKYLFTVHSVISLVNDLLILWHSVTDHTLVADDEQAGAFGPGARAVKINNLRTYLLCIVVFSILLLDSIGYCFLFATLFLSDFVKTPGVDHRHFLMILVGDKSLTCLTSSD